MPGSGKFGKKFHRKPLLKLLKVFRNSFRNDKRFQMIQISDCGAFSPSETVPGQSEQKFLTCRDDDEVMVSPSSALANSSTEKPK